MPGIKLKSILTQNQMTLKITFKDMNKKFKRLCGAPKFHVEYQIKGNFNRNLNLVFTFENSKKSGMPGPVMLSLIHI